MTVATLDNYRSVPCPACFLQIAKRDLPGHVRECPVRLSKMAHPSNRRAAPACDTCGAPLMNVGSGKYPGGYCNAARYGGPGHDRQAQPMRGGKGVGR